MKRRRTTKKRRSSGRSAVSAAKPAFGSPAWFKMYPRKKGKHKARQTREVAASTTVSTTVAAPRKRRKVRRTREAPIVAAPRKRRKARRAREAPVSRVAAPRKRRKVRRAREASVVQAPRRRKTRRVARAWRGDTAGHRKAAKKGWRKKKSHKTRESTIVAAPRRRKVRRKVARAWRGDTAGHRKAAKKGWSRKKKSHKTRESMTVAAPRHHKRRRKSHKTRELSVAAPRRRRHKHHTRETSMVKSRRHYARAGKLSKLSTMGKKLGKLALYAAVAGVGFTLSDGVDRFLATYNPTHEKKPTNKFTSDGAGTLANALNVASSPHALRIANAVGQVLVPAFVSMYVKNPLARSSMESYAVGAGVKAFSLLWTNVLMPMLGAHKTGDDPKKLMGSVIARLYPAEVAAKMNMDQKPTAEGALSGGPDVGPFAIGAPSPYPDAVEALQRQAGVSDNETYPTAAQALRKQTGVDGPYGFRPAPPTGRYGNNPIINRWHGAHPQFQPGGYAHSVAMSRQWGRFQSPSAPGHHHHHCMLRAKTMYPSYTAEQLHSWCLAHPYSTHPYLYVGPTQNPVTGVISAPQDLTDTGLSPEEQANAAPPNAAPAPAPFPPAVVPTPDPVGPPTYAPGPGTSPGPGPQPVSTSDCGCGDDNKFLGFIGDAQEEILFDTTART